MCVCQSFTPLPSCVFQVQDKFRLDLSDEEAVHYMQSLIDESVHALFAAMVEQIHKFAQVKTVDWACWRGSCADSLLSSCHSLHGGNFYLSLLRVRTPEEENP